MLPPPDAIEFLRFAGVQHADADRSIGIKQAYPQKSILPVIDDGEFAHVARPVLIANAVRKKPGMAGTQNRFRFLRNTKPETRC